MMIEDESNIKIVFFYTRINGHVVGLLKAILRVYPTIEIDFIHWRNDPKHGSLYKNQDGLQKNLHLYNRDDMSEEDLLSILKKKKPQLVYVSGWVDKGYLSAVRNYKSSGGVTRVVCGIDDQWKGSIRQYLGRVYFRIFYRVIFDYMWVSGQLQYHYSRRFGYDDRHIIYNLLSADTEVFNRRAYKCRRFVYVGRFSPVKGVELLMDAYNSLPVEIKSVWTLVIIGDGEMKSRILDRIDEGITVLPYLQPSELMDELMKGGVACVPSTKEPWGVVIHEFALLGYPLLVSSACGAASEFLISGHNGYLFMEKQMESLQNAMVRIAGLSDDDLERFGTNSVKLGCRISPEISAVSLLSILHLQSIN
jgi:glycosyltransferase involved in cell wall biosynthesis